MKKQSFHKPSEAGKKFLSVTLNMYLKFCLTNVKLNLACLFELRPFRMKMKDLTNAFIKTIRNNPVSVNLFSIMQAVCIVGISLLIPL
jgi:hypothetical protein